MSKFANTIYEPRYSSQREARTLLPSMSTLEILKSACSHQAS